MNEIGELLSKLFPYSRVTQVREAGRVVRLELAASILPGREAEALDKAVLRQLLQMLDKGPI